MKKRDPGGRCRKPSSRRLLRSSDPANAPPQRRRRLAPHEHKPRSPGTSLQGKPEPSTKPVFLRDSGAAAENETPRQQLEETLRKATVIHHALSESAQNQRGKGPDAPAQPPSAPAPGAQDPPSGTCAPHPSSSLPGKSLLVARHGVIVTPAEGRGRRALQASTLLAFPKTPREERGLTNHSKGELRPPGALSSLRQDRSFGILPPR